jgi:signal transduction histidine kinase
MRFVAWGALHAAAKQFISNRLSWLWNEFATSELDAAKIPLYVSTKAFSTIGYYLGLLPLGLAFLGLSATVIGARWEAQRDAEEVRLETESEARHVAAQLTVGLSHASEGLDRVAAWWLLEGRPMTPDDWRTETRLFATSRLGLRRLIWLDARGRPVWSARPGSAPDHPRELPSSDPAIASAVRSAREIEDTTMAPGGASVFLCAPAFAEGRSRGYIVGQYDVEQLAKSLLASQLPADYAISVDLSGQVVPITGRVSIEHSQTATAEVGGATWRVTLSQLSFGATPLRRAIVIFGVLTSALLFVSASAARVASRRARQVARLNRDLQRRLDEFQTLLDVLPVGIAVAQDPECRRIWTNRTLGTMFNTLESGQLAFSPSGGDAPPPCRIVREGAEVPAEELPMQTAARTGKPVRDVYLDLVWNDGTVLRTLSYAAPLFDERGEVRGVIDVCVDITARRELESRLQQAEKYQSLALMAGGIAHDFNNLLTVILGNASAASAAMPPGTGPARSIAEVEAAATRAADLVSKLLAYTGRFWREMTPIVLSNEIEAAAPELREMIPPSISLRFQLEPNLPAVEAGTSELRQVLRHLTANAVEALEGQDDGSIEIAVSSCFLTESDIGEHYPDRMLRPGAFVRLAVRDNGCGIPEEIQTRVFDPFFTTKFVGRGLGLSAVQGIVRAHGGSVRLSSSAKGTQVEVILPACALPVAT